MIRSCPQPESTPGGADQILFAVLDNMTLISADVFEIV